MAELYLSPVFERLWKGKDPFVEAEKLDGEIFRQVKARRTFRFSAADQWFFAKIHRGIGWGEIWKDWLQFKRPVLGASNEYHAIRLLEKIGVDTMTPAAYGSRGLNPATRKSFLITEELADMTSLEDLCRDWPEKPPKLRQRIALVNELGRIAGLMHRSGLNHRDCYICHFLLDRESADSFTPRLHVIDLHRAQIRPETPYRYVVKDVAGLYFSAMDIGLTRRDIFRFVCAYTQKPLRKALARREFWRDVSAAAKKLYAKEFKREAPKNLP